MRALVISGGGSKVGFASRVAEYSIYVAKGDYKFLIS